MEKTKFRSFGKVAVPLAMAAAMSLGMAQTALAAEYGEKDTPQAAITKKVSTGEGVEIPNAVTFTFTASKVSVDGDTAAAKLAAMPTLTPGTIAFTNTEMVKANDLDTSATKTVYAKQGTNFLDEAAFAGTAGIHAGIYEYTIAEQATYTINPALGTDPAETLTVDGTTYTFKVYVMESATTPGTFYISGVTATKKTVIPGDPGDGDKVDPTPDTVEVVPGSGVDYSGMAFDNIFTRDKGTDTPDPEDPDSYALLVTKTVTGSENDTNAFPFSFTLTKPITAAGASNAYTYSIVADGIVGAAVPATYGTPVTAAALKTGESIIIGQAYEGSVLALSETNTVFGDKSYIPSYSAVLDGATAITGEAAIGKTLALPDNSILGDGANTIAWGNKYQDMTPTGIVMDNLPFVMLIVVAAAGLVAFVAVKSRKQGLAK